MGKLKIVCTCGTDIIFNENQTLQRCPSCTSIHERPKSTGENLDRLQRANTLLNQCRFDEALEVFGKVLEKQPDEHEVLWKQLWCKYGIQAMVTIEGGREVRRLLCHRVRNSSIRNEGDFHHACEMASPEVRAQYEADAEYIDNVQMRVRDAAKKKEPYDVFICYKETSLENPGEKTEDSRIARRMCNEYMEKYRVFFAPYTLLRKSGEDYEAEIYRALSTAKVMLVIGLKKEHMEAPWPKSEWSRYMEIMAQDRSRRLIPVFGGEMRAEDLPAEFRNQGIQGYNTSLSPNYVEDIEHAIHEIFAESESKGDGKAVQGLKNYLHSVVEMEGAIHACETLIQQINTEMEKGVPEIDLPELVLPARPAMKKPVLPPEPQMPPKKVIPVPEKRKVQVPGKTWQNKFSLEEPKKPESFLDRCGCELGCLSVYFGLAMCELVGVGVIYGLFAMLSLIYPNAMQGLYQLLRIFQPETTMDYILMIISSIVIFGIGLGTIYIVSKGLHYLRPSVQKYHADMRKYQAEKSKYETEGARIEEKNKRAWREYERELAAAEKEYQAALEEHARQQAEADAIYAAEWKRIREERYEKCEKLHQQAASETEWYIDRWNGEVEYLQEKYQVFVPRTNEAHAAFFKAYGEIRQKRDELTARLDDLRSQLRGMYANGPLYRSYQDFVAASQICDYIESGLSKALEGDNGAYQQYMNDVRAQRLKNVAALDGEIRSAMGKGTEYENADQFTLSRELYECALACRSATDRIAAVRREMEEYADGIVRLAKQSGGYQHDMSKLLEHFCRDAQVFGKTNWREKMLASTADFDKYIYEKTGVGQNRFTAPEA